ncbi:ATP-dependent metallopeptidase FtsH/Yme1/Tma family protein [Dictyobacter arantiisoli]|uniref:ATP-dependent zinc metalloprotease FtsH n=1 Tax=Dictyobacter arantiisoli TaxID=2014874 RepID=A0A5A5T9I8_9CHLR|nr:AAA family ATPase [Dictyobacter arantiisoli]GCF07693.1 hypothetical protein KDI_12570 [Dictyobacter arantiisoli]
MDDKARRRINAMNKKRRPQRTVSSTLRMWWKFLQDYRSAVLTCLLLTIGCALLFGIAVRLPIPSDDSAPISGIQTADYTTFLHLVHDGNIEAVEIQGNNVYGLVKYSTQVKATASTYKNILISHSAADVAKWQNFIKGNATLTFNADSTSPDVFHSLYMHMPSDGQNALVAQIDASHVPIEVISTPNSFSGLPALLHYLPLIIVVLIFIIFLLYLRKQNPMNSMDDSITQMGKSRARRFKRVQERSTSPTSQESGAQGKSAARTGIAVARPVSAPIATVPPVTFADVAGIDEVRNELSEIVQFLQSPEKFNRLGAHIPCGALLVGEPGTGKTLLAKAVAGEAKVPFFSMSASEFVEMYVGVGASRVRDLFQQARLASPCVVFIDEIDAVARKRSMRASNNDERDQTLNQLLVELDGFDARQAVVVLAATNRVDILDQAVLRPGRFDRRITISAPDRAGREAILRVHAKETPLATDVSLDRLARLTTGMTGADLANLVNEAALTAARRNLECLDHECFEDALARVQLGALRPLLMSEADRRVIAFHEGGHALVAYHLPEADTVNRVTILPRGQSLGVTQFTAEVDRYNYNREALVARIAVGLGGRMAEELTFGAKRITTGAENDFQVVTGLAHKMVTRWGMSERIGTLYVDYRPEESYALNLRCLDPAELPIQTQSLIADAQGNLRFDGSQTVPTRHYVTRPSATRSSGGATMSALVDKEVQHIIAEGSAVAREILTRHKDQLTLLADALLEHEQLDRSQFEALLSQA